MPHTIAFLAGSFHKKLVQEMLDEAAETAQALDLRVSETMWVPGSLEKPLALKHLLARPDIDGAVVFGIIERGETKHGLVMGESVMATIIDLQLEFMKPVGVAILGPEILPDQIAPRLKPYAKKGVQAVREMLDLFSGKRP